MSLPEFAMRPFASARPASQSADVNPHRRCIAAGNAACAVGAHVAGLVSACGSPAALGAWTLMSGRPAVLFALSSTGSLRLHATIARKARQEMNGTLITKA